MFLRLQRAFSVVLRFFFLGHDFVSRYEIFRIDVFWFGVISYLSQKFYIFSTFGEIFRNHANFLCVEQDFFDSVEIFRPVLYFSDSSRFFGVWLDFSRARPYILWIHGCFLEFGEFLQAPVKFFRTCPNFSVFSEVFGTVIPGNTGLRKKWSYYRATLVHRWIPD